MKVLEEILKWSTTLPTWQQDALRRLTVQDELNEDDLKQLLTICKSKHGLTEPVDATPLAKKHLPLSDSSREQVTLSSLTHRDGVNALASDQVIEFGKQLTIVFGYNAAGKSGYTRILKQACRARGAESILGNVLADAAPTKPSAALEYSVGNTAHTLDWSVDKPSSDDLGRISVFDTQSASVYLREKTDVAFRPFGLDLFDKLSDLCESLRKALQDERRELEASSFDTSVFPADTQVSKLLQSLTSLTPPASIEELATLSDDEVNRSILLEKKLKDLESEDPKKLARTLQLRASNIQALYDHLEKVRTLFSHDSLSDLFSAQSSVDAARMAATELRERVFETTQLSGTGTDNWKNLWNAARAFSGVAYPDQEFPFTGEDARCVLCQQEYSRSAADQMQRFEEFVQSASQASLAEARRHFDEKRQEISEYAITTERINQAVEELAIEDESLSESANMFLRNAASYKTQLILFLEGDGPKPSLPEAETGFKKLTDIAATLAARSSGLALGTTDDSKVRITNELGQRQLFFPSAAIIFPCGG